MFKNKLQIEINFSRLKTFLTFNKKKNKKTGEQGD